MFKSILPPNATRLEQAMEETVARLSDIPVPITRYIDPYQCPATLLPWLAWELSVDWWNENWPEARKRAAIAASPDIHMKKGTPSAIRKAIESLGYTVRLFTGRDEKLAPHAFRIEIGIASQGITEYLTREIEQLIHASKNTRSYLARLSLIGETYGAIPVGLSVLSGLETTIYPYIPEDLISHGNIIPAGALQDADRVSVFPLS